MIIIITQLEPKHNMDQLGSMNYQIDFIFNSLSLFKRMIIHFLSLFKSFQTIFYSTFDFFANSIVLSNMRKQTRSVNEVMIVII